MTRKVFFSFHYERDVWRAGIVRNSDITKKSVEAAGFIDAIVGGGGLIQTPMGLILLPNLPVATVIGTLKVPAFSGTSFAAYQYLKKVDMNWKLLAIMMALAFPSAFLGSTLLTYVSNDFMKPLLLVVLSFLIYL